MAEKEPSKYGIRIGTLIVFAVFFPGCVGFGFSALLFSAFNLFSYDVPKMLIVLFVIGIVGNNVGHLLGLLYRRLYREFKDFPFEMHRKAYSMNDPTARALFQSDSEYYFSLFCFYFNSATILLCLSVLRVAILGYLPFAQYEHFWVACTSIISIITFVLAHWMAKGVVKLSNSVRN